MYDYDDTTFYLSNKIYNQDQDPEFKFYFIYEIEYYRYEDEDDHSIQTFDTLYMIPTFSSLSNKRQHDVMEYSGVDDPNTIDVFDYGISIVFAREDTIGEYDKSIIDKIASIVDNIDSLQWFYLEKEHNRIGNDDLMM